MKTENKIKDLLKSSLIYEDAKIVSSKSIPERIAMLQNSLQEVTNELHSINKSEHKTLLKQGRILLLVEDKINLLQLMLQEIKMLMKEISGGQLQQNYDSLRKEQTKFVKLYNVLNYLETLNK